LEEHQNFAPKNRKSTKNLEEHQKFGRAPKIWKSTKNLEEHQNFAPKNRKSTKNLEEHQKFGRFNT